MMTLTVRALDPLANRLSRYWERWGSAVVWVSIVYVAVAAVLRMRFALPHAVRDVETWSAIDLKYRIDEVTRWFDGAPVYGALDRLTYPPASYALLWPLVGWLPTSAARVVWVTTTLLAAATIAAIAYRATEASPLGERVLMASLVFACYPLQIAIYVGQLPVHAVALAAGAAYVLTRGRPGWLREVGGSVLLAASLVKPTLTPPIVLAVLMWAHGHRGLAPIRPTVITAAAYGVLALVASAARPEGIIELHREWLLANSAQVLAGQLPEALPNVHGWLSLVGLGRWGPAAALAMLIAFAAWAWRHKDADPWMLVGAGALVARVWTYHREYDDTVLLLAIIALLRAARGPEAGIRFPSAVLFAASAAAMLTPVWALFDVAPTWIRAVRTAHMALWVVVLASFLVMTPRRPARSPALP